MIAYVDALMPNNITSMFLFYLTKFLIALLLRSSNAEEPSVANCSSVDTTRP